MGPDFVGPGIDNPSGPDGGGSDPDSAEAPDGDDAEGIMLSTGCAPYSSDVYTPFPNFGPVSSGTVASHPWQGRGSSYPESLEDFRGYGVPTTVECGSDKGQRDHLDVTAGCLSAASFGGDKVGQIHGTSSSGYYRSFALP